MEGPKNTEATFFQRLELDADANFALMDCWPPMHMCMATLME